MFNERGFNGKQCQQEDAFYWMLLLDQHHRSFRGFPKVSADVVELMLAKARGEEYQPVDF